ncbi:MAG: PAS domain S-box protein [Desulfobacteraceae bacterium]|jgi:PAS domain S-box-containing protein
MARKPTHEALEQRVKDLEKQVAECRQENEALREEEKRLSLIFHGSSIPTLVIDENHVITHCNRAYEKFRGVRTRDMIGTRNQWMTYYSKPRPVMADFMVDKVSGEEIKRHFGDRCRKSAFAEGAYEAELFFPNLGEKGEWLFFTAAPLMDHEGNILGAVETFQDATKRKHTEEALRRSERRLRTLFDFVPYPIGVFDMKSHVFYVNPAFTEVFGWTLKEVEGKVIPFVPREARQETIENLKRLNEDKILLRHESKRLTKDGRVLDVSIRAAVYSESEEAASGVIAIFRDITQEKKIARTNEAMLRISMALPGYPDLEGLLDYVNSEVKRLLDTEGSVVILLDQEKQELFVIGAAYDATATQKRVKEVRFSMDQLVAGKVIKTGEPIIVSDTSEDRQLHEERDKKLGYKTRNLVLVPLKSSDRIIGVLCGINKKEGVFDRSDVELLEMIAGTVALSIENARVSEELKKAYREVSSLNRAKDKVINHLSHELKTPIAVLSGSLSILTRKLGALYDDTWGSTIERTKRNLDRILEIQYEVDDIIQDKQPRSYGLLSLLLDQCTDELETLVAEQGIEGPAVERIRKRIDELFGPKQAVPKEISLEETVKQRLKHLKPMFAHREVEIITQFEPAPAVLMPPEVLQKVIDGLIKNAVENTPDEGKIEVAIQKKGEGSLLLVHDYGVGITEEAQRRIFEGFFTTQDTMAYSSKRPFDFNAGGKGADLLRMKIFSERYHFQIDMASSRCRFIPHETDVCPGRISKCPFCSNREDCHRSGGTVFSLYFPPAPRQNQKAQA